MGFLAFPNIRKKGNVKSLEDALVVFLVMVAVLLGVRISEEKRPQEKTTALSVVSNSPTPKRTLPENLTAQERELFDVPGPDATPPEREKHFQLALKLAKEVDEIAIKDCFGSPVVARVSEKGTLKVRNEDSATHNIGFDQDHNLTVPSKETRTITSDFKFGKGLYGYTCDGPSGVAGFLILP